MTSRRQLCETDGSHQQRLDISKEDDNRLASRARQPSRAAHRQYIFRATARSVIAATQRSPAPELERRADVRHVARQRHPQRGHRATRGALGLVAHAVLLAGLATGCDLATSLPAGVVATVNGVEIRAGDLRARYRSASPEERERASIAGGRHYLLDLAAADALLEAEARRRFGGPSFGVAEPFHRPLMERFVREVFEPTVSPGMIARAEIEAEYARIEASLRRPERRHIKQIGAPTEDDARAILARAEAAVRDRDEATLVNLLHGPENDRFGGLDDLVDRTEAVTYLGEPIAAAAFAAESPPAVLPDVYPTGATWSVVIVRDVFPPAPAPPLEEIERSLRDVVFTSHRDRALDSWVAGFRDGHRVTISHDMFDLVPWTDAGDAPVGHDAGTEH
jgi:hypothetical protein